MNWIEKLYKEASLRIEIEASLLSEPKRNYTFTLRVTAEGHILIYVPGHYVGLDGMGEPDYPQQGQFLEAYGAKSVWDGQWMFYEKEDFERWAEAVNDFMSKEK